ncbi:hypothetical protein EB796_012869 [Bugula neritina]|uniref:Uncharacterized protein n=1 Tax=Bugula neritina TaxID=10212 RepID=A0A7J7JT63_BUGNE|nr:hypothetical protein EB796_012869 [Bugula neritina]
MFHSTFYNDLKTMSSISLTSFTQEEMNVHGSFMSGDEKFDIQPYQPRIHKRSTSAQKGDHIITKREVDKMIGNSCFVCK